MGILFGVQFATFFEITQGIYCSFDFHCLACRVIIVVHSVFLLSSMATFYCCFAYVSCCLWHALCWYGVHQFVISVCNYFIGMAAATYYTTDEDWEPSGTSQNFASLISIFSTVTSFIFFGLASGSTTMARDRLEQEIELRKTYKNYCT